MTTVDDDQHFEDGGRRFAARRDAQNVQAHLSDLGIVVMKPAPSVPRSREEHSADADDDQRTANEATAMFVVALVIVGVLGLVQLIRYLIS